jgi:NAD(P)-dependent dehydrogenase (short-subunit alcohol dehydrogenase family)
MHYRSEYHERMSPIALIVGAGSGLSGSLARLLAKEGFKVALASRNPDKNSAWAKSSDFLSIGCDAVREGDVEAAFDTAEKKWGVPDLAVYNASWRTRGAIESLAAADVERALSVCAFAGFLVGRAAAKRMLARGSGAIFFTGASASVKGYPQSAPFAMGKFALRGLAQSMARELAPKNIHVAHFVIDGAIKSEARAAQAGEDALLDPDEIARSYLAVYRQQRSAWSWELELRPWLEKF